MKLHPQNWILAAALIAGFITGAPRAAAQVETWLTRPDQTTRFEKQPSPLPWAAATGRQTSQTIAVDAGTTYQTIDGFGFCLTGGSAMNLMRMGAPARGALLRELFGTAGASIGVSYLRLSIGASDLNDRVFSYDDVAAGQADPELRHFSLDPDRGDVIAVLKEILRIAPELKIMGSPWSAPSWMKTNGRSKGGSLKPEYYPAYAQYFVKYITGMKAEGIRIDAITVQNEPLHPGNNPSMVMTAPEQAEFIKKHLGPAFKAAGIETKIILYDHNCDRPDYPISILNDPEARQYVDGSAFHLYGGKITALTTVHEAHPDKNLYFTEQWMGAPGNFRRDFTGHIRDLTIGATRNWSRTVLEWNLAADPAQRPHTDGGCTSCLGGVTLDGDNVKRNAAYYVVAHAAKFVRPGSVRIASNETPALADVAFKTPGGGKVLIVLNRSQAPQTFAISEGARQATAILSAGAVGTYVW